MRRPLKIILLAFPFIVGGLCWVMMYPFFRLVEYLYGEPWTGETWRGVLSDGWQEWTS